MVKIAFSGKMCSGKTTLAKYLEKKIPGSKRMAIGDEIKLFSREILYDFDKVNEKVQNYERKDAFLDEAAELHRNNKNKPFEFDESGEFIKNELYRPYIQEVGALARKYFGQSIWMDLFLKNVVNEKKKGTNFIICDDARSEHEYKTFQKIGSMFIRLEVEEEEQIKRIKNLYGSLDKNSLYEETETALDDKYFDFVYETTVKTVKEIGERILEDYYGSFKKRTL